MKSPSDEEIMRALIHQVAKAANGSSEQNVTTVITRPMWNAFLRATGMPENMEPSPEWGGVRVYGSKTIVIDSGEMAAISSQPEKESFNGTYYR